MRDKDLAYRIGYELIVNSVEDDSNYENLEFVCDTRPHKTIDKLITYFENTEEYEKCGTLLRIKSNRLDDYELYNI